MQRKWSHALFTDAQCQDQRQCTPAQSQKVPSEHYEMLLYLEDNQDLAQSAQRGCGVLLFRDPQKMPGPMLEHPALGGSAGTGGGTEGHRGPS